MHDLERFLKAQKNNYPCALSEIKRGHKRSHWIWYIFPQIEGLGYSETSKYYAIKDKAEAQAYLDHPILGNRLLEITEELLRLNTSDARDVMGYPDDIKLKSSMTLFALVSNNPVFQHVLDKYFYGEQDQNTILRMKDGSK